MRVLIIGGNGFIGSHLTDFLVAKGQTVRVYSHSRSIYTKEDDKKVEYIYGEFTDTKLLDSSLQDIEVVYQLISTTVPSTSNKSPVEDVASNLISTIKLLESCVNYSVKKSFSHLRVELFTVFLKICQLVRILQPIQFVLMELLN